MRKRDKDEYSGCNENETISLFSNNEEEVCISQIIRITGGETPLRRKVCLCLALLFCLYFVNIFFQQVIITSTNSSILIISGNISGTSQNNKTQLNLVPDTERVIPSPQQYPSQTYEQPNNSTDRRNNKTTEDEEIFSSLDLSDKVHANLAPLTIPFNSDKDIPLFWHVSVR